MSTGPDQIIITLMSILKAKEYWAALKDSPLNKIKIDAPAFYTYFETLIYRDSMFFSARLRKYNF